MIVRTRFRRQHIGGRVLLIAMLRRQTDVPRHVRTKPFRCLLCSFAPRAGAHSFWRHLYYHGQELHRVRAQGFTNLTASTNTIKSIHHDRLKDERPLPFFTHPEDASPRHPRARARFLRITG